MEVGWLKLKGKLPSEFINVMLAQLYDVDKICI